MSSSLKLLVGLLVVIMLALGYAAWQQNRSQSLLDTQLHELAHVLEQQNSAAVTYAGSLLKSTEAAVVKNQNQARDLSVLRRATALDTAVRTILDSLESVRNRLLRATGNSAGAPSLRHPNETASVAQLLDKDARTRQALQQQLATCVDTLIKLGPASPTPVLMPAFDGLTLVQALAVITELESTVLSREGQVLRHLAKHVGVRTMPTYLVAAATAETNTVTPGDTYRARLQLLKSVVPANMKMYYNGRPLQIEPNGLAKVRFRAPQQLGPAAWNATIRINQNGRDSTFTLRVPYQVARP
jgi:hypothetical protein